MVDMSAYKQPVHRSLLPREMFGGIPQIGFFILLLFALVFVYGLQLYYSIIPIVLAYFVMRHFTKKDNWMLDFLFDNIMQKDKYLP
jgi:type IV secretory pathway TrbD component